MYLDRVIFMGLTILPQNGLFTTARRLLADKVFPEGKEQRNLAERAANIDDLTGLANRRAFNLAQVTAESDDSTVFIIFDANNFGKVNKLLGHQTGDKVLQNMAKVLKLAASRYKVTSRVFRLGGDEFVIICPASFGEQLRDAIEKMYVPFLLSDGSTVSISGTIGNTLAEADSKLQDRKNCCRTFLFGE